MKHNYVIDYANTDEETGVSYECEYIAFAEGILEALADFQRFMQDETHRTENYCSEIFSIKMVADVITDDTGAIIEVHDNFEGQEEYY